MATRATATNIQKLCLQAEVRGWRVKLSTRSNSDGDSVLEDLSVEDRGSGKMLAAEDLYEKNVEEASEVILHTLT